MHIVIARQILLYLYVVTFSTTSMGTIANKINPIVAIAFIGIIHQFVVVVCYTLMTHSQILVFACSFCCCEHTFVCL